MRVGRTAALYVVASFAAAFLIFLVQPMVGKRILPGFGGVPAVWAVCLAFFQTSLFLGYAYAHGLIRFASRRAQVGVHAGVLVLAVGTLPVLPRPEAVVPDGAAPAAQVAWILATSVALPFLVLAATGPLVQAWFARAAPGRSPYPLYAVSNAGSLLALFSYPFWIEPHLTLSLSGDLWSIGFVGVAVLVLGCGLLAARASDAASPSPEDGEKLAGSPVAPGHTALWVLLPGCAVVLLMGITNLLCLDVASVPFLWILPLATYLLTFIIGFAGERFYRPTPFALLAVVSFFGTDPRGFWLGRLEALAGREILAVPDPLPIGATMLFGTLLLFGTCMILHGELYRLRPPPRRLTGFYLSVSAGGAIGGAFVGVLAPQLFPGFWELHLGLALCCVLFFLARRSDSHGLRLGRWPSAAATCAALCVVVYGGWGIEQPLSLQVHQERSFFGILRVTENREGRNAQKQLHNGTTLHGVQFTHGASSKLPTSYYGRATGIGLALGVTSRDEEATLGGGEGRKIGVVGLGVGTLAAYGRGPDLFRFYEIDPAVERVAREEFSFLRESAAGVEVVLGDARLSLADELGQGGSPAWDWLVVDAFTSDAVPVHLLTREAFLVYRDALAADGVLAIHVSSRHFDLTRLVARMGLEVGLSNLVVRSPVAPKLQSRSARWVMLARDPDRLAAMRRRMLETGRSLGLEAGSLRVQQLSEAEVADLPVWTDDYTDLLGLLGSGS